MSPNNLALIPARGGSKRLPGKNTRLFWGKPIISYSVAAAIGSGLFSEVMVSTDDDSIATTASACGASVPFRRGEENSCDNAGLAEVVEEVLRTYSRAGREFENVCVILATAPFVTPEKLRQGYDRMLSTGADGVIPVVKFSYPVQRALHIEADRLFMMWPENYSKRSQDLEPAYHDTGQFYWLRTEAFLREKVLFLSSCTPLEVSELEAEDIDTEDNFALAEIKYGFLRRKKHEN